MANSRVKTIEAVITCFDYSDFLVETLPHNINHFEHVVVVTSFEDIETQTFCREHSIHCIPTDVHKYDDAEFAKARAVDLGLAFLTGTDWLVHMDADIWLPPLARQAIDDSMPDKDCIYGIDRFNCNSYEAWKKYVTKQPQHHFQKRHHCLLDPPPFPMGARLVLKEYKGYVPIGYFQMWHAKHRRRYPLNHGTAERTDVLHALQWPSNNRHLLEELYCIHLTTSSDPTKMGDNWNGRKTAQFGYYDPYRFRRKREPIRHRHHDECYNHHHHRR